jgi:hypothetical protein
MSLLQLWQSTPDQILSKRLHQLITFAGEGKLLDGGSASAEFRAFLGQVPSSLLAKFVDECLAESFSDGGFALQDVINEVGRRLGFAVTNGAYKGKQGAIGYDGLWTFPTKHSVVVEVKTTDAYRIDTTRIAGYRKALATQGVLSEEQSSILLVVGRQDTGDLEAQIRGSRHAWDVRIISADALLRLVGLKETLDDPATIGRICGILVPKEYTRLDEIVDLVFSATEEAKEEASEPEGDDGDAASAPASDSATKPVAFHDACVARVAKHRGITLVKTSRSKYAQPNGDVRVVCAVSKFHGKRGPANCWFAYHPHQRDYLSASKGGLLVLGCGAADRVLSVPAAIAEGWLDDLWTTEKDDGSHYWHLRITIQGGRYLLSRKEGKARVDLSQFAVP